MARRDFPRKVKAAAIARAAGHCEKCKAVLKPREGEVDHILPDILGGEPTLINAQVLCRICHAEKTVDDIRRTRKADRARDKASGAMRSKQPIRSRGFEKTPKPTKLPLPERKRPMFAALSGRGELWPAGKGDTE